VMLHRSANLIHLPDIIGGDCDISHIIDYSTKKHLFDKRADQIPVCYNLLSVQSDLPP